MAIDLDPIEVQGRIREDEDEQGVINLDPIEIEGTVGPAEYGELKNAQIGVAPQNIWEAIDRALTAVPRGDDGTYEAAGVEFSPEAVAYGANDGLALGFLDELAGAASAIDGFADDPAGTAERYRSTRDEMRGTRDELREQHPGSMLAGGLGSVAVSGPLMAGALPAQATARGRIAQGVAEGAGFGALSGLGSTDASGVDAARDMADGMMTGGAIGGGLSVAGEGIRSGLRRLADGAGDAQRTADMMRVRQATGAQTPELRRLNNRGVLERAAEMMRERGMLGRGRLAGQGHIQGELGAAQDAAGDVLGNMRQQMEAQSASIGGVLDDLDDAIRAAEDFDPSSAAASQLRRQRDALLRQAEAYKERLRRRLLETGTGGGARGERERIRRELMEDRVPFAALDSRRAQVGDILNVEARNPTGAEQAMRRLYGQLAEAQQGAIDAVSPELGDAVRAANQDYTITTALLGGAENAGLRDASRRAISPTDYASGLAAAASSGGNAAADGLGAMLLNKTVRAAEPRVLATVNERLAQAGRSVDMPAATEAISRARQVGTLAAGDYDAAPPIEAPPERAPAPMAVDDQELDAFLTGEGDESATTDEELDAFLNGDER